MGLKKKAEIILFPVAFAAGIIAGIAIKHTGKKAAEIAACEAAMTEELPAAEPEDAAEELPAAETEDAAEVLPAAEPEVSAEEL